MKKIMWTKIYKGYPFLKILGITMLAFLMLMNTSGAVPFVYITNAGSNTVSIINTSTNKITAMVNLESPHFPLEVAITPDGTKVYVTNSGSNNVS